MNVLGLRCSNKDFTYVLLTGNRENPEIVASNTFKYPKGFTKPKSLRWFQLELEGLCKTLSPDSIVVKGTEWSAAKGKAYTNRVEFETIAFLVAESLGDIGIDKKVKATISKDLGLKGKAKYIETKLDTSVIINFDEYNSKAQEAILAAWSNLQ